MPIQKSPRPTAKSTRSAAARRPQNKPLGFFKKPMPSRFTLIAIVALTAILGIAVVAASFGSSNIAVASSTFASTNIPKTGLYWGGTNNGDNNSAPGCAGLDDYALLQCKVAWAGRQQSLAAAPTTPTSYASSMQHFFTDCDTPIGNAIKASAATAGRKAIMVNMTCGSWTALKAAPATQVAKIKARTKELADLNIPVIFSFHHEPENDSCNPVRTYFGTPEDYRAAYRVFSNAVRTQAKASGSTKIATGWILMGFTYQKDGAALWNGSCTGHTRGDDMMRNPDNWYPGDDAVDWLLSDSYDDGGTRNFTQMASGITDWAATCRASHPSTNYTCGAAKQAKPQGFGETAVTGNSAHRAAYFADMVTAIKNFPKFKSYAYWSAIDPNSGYDGRLDLPNDTNRLALKGYASVELSSYVHNLSFPSLASPTPVPTPVRTPVPTPSPAPVSDTVKPDVRFTSTYSRATGITPFDLVTSDNVGVVRVQLTVDGTVVAIDNDAPYGPLNWYTDNFSVGPHQVQLQSYDAAGNRGLSGAQTINVYR